MVSWNFIINPDTDNLQIEEPVGWDDISFALQRDKKYHGITIAYGETLLTLVDDAADLIRTAYENDGIDADVKIRVQLLCDEVVESEEDFQFDFGQYKKLCGDECAIQIGIEEISCFQKFKNNFEKKANVDSETCFDNSTTSTQPTELIQEILLTPVSTQAIDEARTSHQFTEDLKAQPDWFPNSGTTMDAWMLPALDNVVYSSLGDFNPSSYPALFNGGAPTVPPFETMPVTVNTTELLNDITCGLGDTVAKFRLKGTVVQQRSNPVGTTTFQTLKLVKLPAGGDPDDAGDWIVEYSLALPALNDNDTESFDTGDVTVTLTDVNQGDKFYWAVFLQSTPATNVSLFSWQQDVESYFRIETLVSCESTTAQVYMIYETISHVLKLMTDTCLKLESTYYGRKTGTPETYSLTGCGALRVLTSGLYIRKAEKPTFFISMKEIIDNLQCIDNIGWAVEKNSSDENVLRVESVREFYQDVEILKLPFVNEGKEEVIPSDIMGIVKVGYEKWQAERILGLDELMSTREFRSSLQQATQTFDAVCKFIAASYVIEWTREQSFAKTGAADTKFDNDIFIICVNDVIKSQFSFVEYGNYIIAPPSNYWVVGHQYTFSGTQFNNNTYTVTSISETLFGYFLGIAEAVTDELDVIATAEDIVDPAFAVEKGNVTNDANVVSASTMYNWRISPIRNMLRLWKSLCGGFQNTSTGKFFFDSGTGNITAESFIDDTCSPELATIAENSNVQRSIIKSSSDFMPIIKPENFTFEYPLSVEDFLKIRANPYGYISVQCGNGSYEKYHIIKLSFKPTKGAASFTFAKRYVI